MYLADVFLFMVTTEIAIYPESQRGTSGGWIAKIGTPFAGYTGKRLTDP